MEKNEAPSLETLEEIKTLKDDETPKKKNNSGIRFLVYFLIIIVLSVLALVLSLTKNFEGVKQAFQNVNWGYFLIVPALLIFSYLVEGFTIFILSKLYTRKFRYRNALTTAMIGAFYGSITPGGSGGQAIQAMAMKKKGLEISSAASIVIMSYIIYQIVFILYGLIGVVFRWNLISTMGNFTISIGSSFLISIPAIPFTIVAFGIKLFMLLALFFMSSSRKFHNFVATHGINLLAKIRIIKDKEKTRDNLMVQVENFRIELRRLSSNIPITILLFFCFAVILAIRFSIPYWLGVAFDGYGYLVDTTGAYILSESGEQIMSTGSFNFISFWNSVFLSCLQTSLSSLIPIPGGAGISEYFYKTIFAQFFKSDAIITSTQITWRFFTYHLVILIAGLITTGNKMAPNKENAEHASRKTFVSLQYETLAIRKESAETMYQTATLSRSDLAQKLRGFGKKQQEKSSKIKHKETKILNEKTKEEKIEVEKPKKIKKDRKTKEVNPYADFDEINIGDE